MRINRHDLPDLFPENQEFIIGKPYQIRDGRDVVVFANGIMVSKAIQLQRSSERKIFPSEW